jgi:hypothetical protein
LTAASSSLPVAVAGVPTVLFLQPRDCFKNDVVLFRLQNYAVTVNKSTMSVVGFQYVGHGMLGFELAPTVAQTYSVQVISGNASFFTASCTLTLLRLLDTFDTDTAVKCS